MNAFILFSTLFSIASSIAGGGPSCDTTPHRDVAETLQLGGFDCKKQKVEWYDEGGGKFIRYAQECLKGKTGLTFTRIIDNSDPYEECGYLVRSVVERIGGDPCDSEGVLGLFREGYTKAGGACETRGARTICRPTLKDKYSVSFYLIDQIVEESKCEFATERVSANADYYEKLWSWKRK